MIEDSIRQYDAEGVDKTDRGDLLAYLQQRGKSTSGTSHQEMMNHLMNNLYV